MPNLEAALGPGQGCGQAGCGAGRARHQEKEGFRADQEREVEEGAGDRGGGGGGCERNQEMLRRSVIPFHCERDALCERQRGPFPPSRPLGSVLWHFTRLKDVGICLNWEPDGTN